MRNFVLVRDEDVAGISGVGTIAEVTEFSTGKAVVAWQPPFGAIEVFDALEHVKQIHGHDGKTRLVPVIPDTTQPTDPPLPT